MNMPGHKTASQRLGAMERPKTSGQSEIYSHQERTFRIAGFACMSEWARQFVDMRSASGIFSRPPTHAAMHMQLPPQFLGLWPSWSQGTRDRLCQTFVIDGTSSSRHEGTMSSGYQVLEAAGLPRRGRIPPLTRWRPLRRIPTHSPSHILGGISLCLERWIFAILALRGFLR